MDEEGVASQELARQQPAHTHSAQASILRQPAAARVVSGHHHRFDAHNVAVTATHRKESVLVFDDQIKDFLSSSKL